MNILTKFARHWHTFNIHTSIKHPYNMEYKYKHIQYINNEQYDVAYRIYMYIYIYIYNQ